MNKRYLLHDVKLDLVYIYLVLLQSGQSKTLNKGKRSGLEVPVAEMYILAW